MMCVHCVDAGECDECQQTEAKTRADIVAPLFEVAQRLKASEGYVSGKELGEFLETLIKALEKE